MILITSASAAIAVAMIAVISAFSRYEPVLRRQRLRALRLGRWGGSRSHFRLGENIAPRCFVILFRKPFICDVDIFGSDTICTHLLSYNLNAHSFKSAK